MTLSIARLCNARLCKVAGLGRSKLLANYVTGRHPLICSTTDSVHGHQIVKHLGLVTGSTVRTRNVGYDVLASFRQIIGGEVTSYTGLLVEARAEAMERLEQALCALFSNLVHFHVLSMFSICMMVSLDLSLCASLAFMTTGSSC